MIREVWGLNKVLRHVKKTGSMLGRCYLKISALLVLFSADTHFVLPIIIFLIFISVHQWALSKWALFSALSLSLQILLVHSRWLRPTYWMNTKFKMLRKYRRSQRKTVKLRAWTMKHFLEAPWSLLEQPSLATIQLPTSHFQLHGMCYWLNNTVPDTRSYGISNMSCTPGLGRPRIDGSNGKTENELGESHSALQAAGGFGRDKHFPLDAWLWKERK